MDSIWGVTLVGIRIQTVQFDIFYVHKWNWHCMKMNPMPIKLVLVLTLNETHGMKSTLLDNSATDKSNIYSGVQAIW